MHDAATPILCKRFLMSLSLLSVFIPTFFFVSITPGMCMTLALSLGMQFGYRRTVWMMLGEVVGVGLVALSAVLGVAAIMLKFPWMFTVMKTAGAAYLFYIGLSMWQSKGRLALPSRRGIFASPLPVAANHSGVFNSRRQPQGLGVYDCTATTIY